MGAAHRGEWGRGYQGRPGERSFWLAGKAASKSSGPWMPGMPCADSYSWACCSMLKIIIQRIAMDFLNGTGQPVQGCPASGSRDQDFHSSGSRAGIGRGGHEAIRRRGDARAQNRPRIGRPVRASAIGAGSGVAVSVVVEL